MVMGLIRPSTAAHFQCNDSSGITSCTITLNSGNTIQLSDVDGRKCTHDGNYCVTIGSSNGEFSFSVTNQGNSCFDYCFTHQACDTTGLVCWNECEKDAC